jgi:hypothetical protein
MNDRLRGELRWYALLLAGIVFVLAAYLGFVLAFARPLPAGAWAGFGVVLAVGVAIAAFAGKLVFGEDRPTTDAVRWAARAPRNGVRRVLVVANETIGTEALREEVCSRALGCESEVLVIAPALNSPIRHWMDDDAAAQSAARERLDKELALLGDLGVRASGEVGADDPLQAIDDALRVFPANEIIIGTHPPGESNWLEREVVTRAASTYRLPVRHVVAPKA